jgi:hypothetical protein
MCLVGNQVGGKSHKRGEGGEFEHFQMEKFGYQVYTAAAG